MEEIESIRLTIARGYASNYTQEQFDSLIERISRADFAKWEKDVLIQYCMDQARYNNAQIEQKIKELING